MHDTGLLGQDSDALGGYLPGSRLYDGAHDITTVRFKSGSIGRYGNGGHVRLSLTPPIYESKGSHSWRYVTNVARQREAEFISNASRSPMPHPRVETFGEFAGPVTRPVVDTMHSVGRLGQQTAYDWSNAVDNGRVGLDNWAKSTFVPERLRREIVGPPKQMTIDRPNDWRDFAQNPNGVIAGDVLKIAGSGAPSIVGLLNTRNVSDLSGAMGPVPEAVGTSLGAIMRMSSDPKVGAQGLSQAMNKLFMHDFPTDPVGTVLSAIPFADIPHVFKDTGGVAATKFYAARDEAIADANARARAGDTRGAARARNQAIVMDAIGNGIEKQFGRPGKPVSTAPSEVIAKPRPIVRDYSPPQPKAVSKPVAPKPEASAQAGASGVSGGPVLPSVGAKPGDSLVAAGVSPEFMPKPREQSWSKLIGWDNLVGKDQPSGVSSGNGSGDSTATGGDSYKPVVATETRPSVKLQPDLASAPGHVQEQLRNDVISRSASPSYPDQMEFYRNFGIPHTVIPSLGSFEGTISPNYLHVLDPHDMDGARFIAGVEGLMNGQDGEAIIRPVRSESASGTASVLISRSDGFPMTRDDL